MGYQDAIALAAAASPMGSGLVPVVPNRILLADGDGLAYYCAGKDGSDAGEARKQLVAKVKSAARMVGAEYIKVLLTDPASHKGHRYAIARVKPYQGQRSGSRRPDNWLALRDFMDGSGLPFDRDASLVAEADDLFGWYSYNYPDDVVHYTQDKDMRMLPGLHLDWVSHRLHKVEYSLDMFRERERMYNINVHDSMFNEKQYGPKWFWMQMLHGDSADNIPGLPLATIKYGGSAVDPKYSLNRVGEAAANKIFAGHVGQAYHDIVAAAYRSYYGERWLVEMMEQACLLWMRRVPEHWDDCMNPGGPLDVYNDGEEEFAKAYLEIQRRVYDADILNTKTKAE